MKASEAHHELPYSPLPVNSDLWALLQDQTLAEFAGRGVGGEGLLTLPNLRAKMLAFLRSN